MIPKGTRTAFRAEGERFLERSDAGNSIVQEVFGFVKEKLSEAQRRNSAASEERGVGKGRHVLSPPQQAEARSARSAPHETQIYRMSRQGGVTISFHLFRYGRLSVKVLSINS